MTWPTKHLTAEDLDAFHSGALSSEMRFHLETCSDCRTLLSLDGRVVGLLEQAPSLGPAEGFADRVMARVTIAEPAPVPVLSFPRLTRRRLVGLGSLAAGIAASVLWSTFNRVLLEGWLDRTTAGLWNWSTELWARGLALVAEPLARSFAPLGSAPGRLVLLATALMIGYGSGVVALRRLIAVSDARA